MATGTGTRIKRAREQKRWTQRELAAALKVSIKTVDNWENGRTSPKNSVGAIEQVLGISLDGPEPEPDLLPPGLRARIRRTLPPHLAAAVEADVEEALAEEAGLKRRRAGGSA